MATPSAAPVTSEVHDRILKVSYGLFCRHGIRAVGVDTIIERAGVAKMSFYRHFGSKDALVLAAMEHREERWTRHWLQAESARRGVTPVEQLLAIFEIFDGWFRKRNFEGCLFINVLLEIDDRRDPVHLAARRHLANIRELVGELARDAGVRDPENLARQWHILMKGSIVAAAEGDRDAALRAKQMAGLVLDSALPASKTRSSPVRS